jgi:putative DNA modification/repair radical SAM protein
MDIFEKLKILSDSAKYDVSCSSSGGNRKNSGNGMGNSAPAGICHAWSQDGRCVSLLKILYSNCCIYDCVYCINRKSNSIQRASFTVDEVVTLTMNFYKRNYIEGLFLSSGVFSTPDKTMEELYQVVKKLRTEHNFHGYIHLKAIPGAAPEIIAKAGKYADRMSVNIELPSEKSLQLLAPEKKKENIIKPMDFISKKSFISAEEAKKYKHFEKFVPAGQSTQMIVGASPETDLQIVKLMENMYDRFNLKRIYYSAYIPVNIDKKLPALAGPPLVREHRLYQADWLLRFYGFKADEIVDEKDPFLDSNLDPKVSWALRNINKFPIEINRADYEMLLRIPGIGVTSAKRIVAARRAAPITFDTLKKIGVVLKRAKYFITVQGKQYNSLKIESEFIRNELLYESGKNGQLKLW